MKLEGSLDAFSLPDVFQLLSLTKKTGGLHLANGQARGVVYFAGGAVTGACSDASRQSLARRLVGLGAVDDAALRRAVERAQQGEVGVARALLDASAVDQDVVRGQAAEQIIDAVFDLLRWSDGEFSLGVDETNPDDVGVALPSDQVVSEAADRRETWEAVSRVIPSPDVVLVMPVVLPTEPVVGRREWSLLALVDGQRSVGDLVEISGVGPFSTVSSLATLVQQGLLHVHDEDSPDHASAVRRRHQLLAPLEGRSDVPAAATDATPAAPAAPASPAPAPATAAPAGAPAGPSAGASVTPSAPAPAPSQPVAPAAAASTGERPGLLGGAHTPQGVVPPRPEPFLPKRAVDHPEPGEAPAGAPAPSPSSFTTSPRAPLSAPGGGGAAVATQPVGAAAIERDPTVNRSLLLRLIAGVRGL